MTVVGWMRGGRALLLPAVIVVAATTAVAAGALAIRDALANRTIAAIAAGRDIAVELEARTTLLFARAYFLMVRDRIDEASPLVEQVVLNGPPAEAAALLYNLANARLRAAVVRLEVNEIDPAVPLVRLAKNDYRRALALDPGFWDARYNLDVAMRLIRDFPELETSEEEEPPGQVRRLWTDLPGLPKGLP